MIETTPGQILGAAEHPKLRTWEKLGAVAQPADLAWEIQWVLEALQKTIEFYLKRKRALLDELAVPTPGKPGEYDFQTEEAKEEFVEQHQKLIEFPVRLSLDKLERKHIEAAELSAAEVLLMKWLFVRDEFEMEDPFVALDSPNGQMEVETHG